jgi:hypothetical protein
MFSMESGRAAMEIGLRKIGLGSMVVQQPGGGLVMCVTAVDGDHLFCVSTDNHKSVRPMVLPQPPDARRLPAGAASCSARLAGDRLRVKDGRRKFLESLMEFSLTR